MDNNKYKYGSVAAVAIAIITATVVHFEGDVPKGYKDPIGIPTAGVGHTGPDVIVGKYYTEAQRKEWLNGDLEKADKVVMSCVNPDKIDVYQRAAFISLAFNIGGGKKGVKDGFCTLRSGKQSTVSRKANAGDKPGSCKAMLSWNRAGGKVLKGLVRRREAEYKICMQK